MREIASTTLKCVIPNLWAVLNVILKFCPSYCFSASKAKTASRRFSCAAPAMWNELPRTIRDAEAVGTFKSRMMMRRFSLRDYMTTWLHDYMTTWLHDYMTTWLHDWHVHASEPWLTSNLITIDLRRIINLKTEKQKWCKLFRFISF